MEPVLEIEGLVKHFGRTAAVDGVSLSVPEGMSFGYLGPNGSGKTTTLRCILGLIRPSAGRIRLFGHDISHDLGAALTDVGYLPGEFALWPSMTGAECLGYLGALHPRPPVRRAELCDRFELSGADLGRQIREYSRGMKQKIGIVQAFQHAPKLVLLDEPTEGLDPMMKGRFVRLVQEHVEDGGTTFLSSHILSEVEAATERVGVLKRGKLVKTGPSSDLRGDRVRHCTLVLKEPASLASVLSLAGVSILEQEDIALRFDHRGDMEPLLRAVASLPVEEFLVEPERLAEAFFDVFEEAS